MNKEEILKKSREENKERDFVEAEALGFAYRAALGVGMMVCGVLSILQAILADRQNCGIWTVYFSVLATVMIVKYVKLRKRHELALGLLYGGFCITFFALHLHDLLRAS